MTAPIAHTPPTPAASPHDLVAHLRETGCAAGQHAGKWGDAWARAAGLWHDLGKFNPAFQAYLHACIAANLAGTAPMKMRIDHSTAGAIHAVRQWGPEAGMVIAYVIAGHHAGLPDCPSAGGEGVGAGRAALAERLKRTELLDAAMRGSPPAAALEAGVPLAPMAGTDPGMFIRMLFSCLVDADRLNTELYLDSRRAVLRQEQAAAHDDMKALDHRLAEHLAVRFRSAALTEINRLRRELLRDCTEAAALSSGLFSLTAPTGLGKTLSGLAFCTKHAATHGKRRVIYVAPYTSIIEQTAAIYREALGAHNVLEHHSAFDPAASDGAEDDEADPNHKAEVLWRLAVENWDAPVVVTTAVQFLESLHSSHPGRCRKLHRIVDSVVFLDEAQLMPTDFLAPIGPVHIPLPPGI